MRVSIICAYITRVLEGARLFCLHMSLVLRLLSMHTNFGILAILFTQVLAVRSEGVRIDESVSAALIMAYGSTPYVGMAPKKMAATLKVHK